MVIAIMKLKKKKRKKEKLAYWKKIYDQPRPHIKKKRHCFADKGPSNQSNVFFAVNIYRCENWSPRKLSTEELMLLSCGVGEDFQESLGLQDQISQP